MRLGWDVALPEQVRRQRRSEREEVGALGHATEYGPRRRPEQPRRRPAPSHLCKAEAAIAQPYFAAYASRITECDLMLAKLIYPVPVLIAALPNPLAAHDIYSHLTDANGASCCSDRDCRPAMFRVTRNAIRMFVAGRWIKVPADKIQYRSLPGRRSDPGTLIAHQGLAPSQCRHSVACRIGGLAKTRG